MRPPFNRITVLAITFACLGIFGVLLTIDAVQDFLAGGTSFLATFIPSFTSSILLFTSQKVTITISNLGYSGVFLLMFLESTSLPIPSEVILPFSGYLASVGRFDIWELILLSTLAGVGGSLVDYYIGYSASKWGRSRFFRRFPAGEGQFERVERWFEHHGPMAVFFTRMIPGARTLVSFPAGAGRMNLSKFVVFTAAGCFLWSALLVYAGWFFGIHWTEFLGIIHYFSIIAIVSLCLGILAWFVLRRKRQVRNEQHI